jgi:hypothetical protein
LHEERIIRDCNIQRSGAVIPGFYDALVEEERKELSGGVSILQAKPVGAELSDGLLDFKALLQRSDADDSYVYER